MKRKKLNLRDNFTKMISKMHLGITSLFLMPNGVQRESNKWDLFLIHLNNQIIS